MKISVYTDGSATTKDRPGGWAYVLLINDKKHAECSGHMAGASNNDAELEAVIQGLAECLRYVSKLDDTVDHADVTLYSDSQLILGWASGIYKFKQHNKLYKYNQLKFLVNRLNVKTEWVEGHSGNEYNERCDKLANEARLLVSHKKDRASSIAEGKTLIGTKKAGTLCVWYKDSLKVIDLETNVVENYDREVHGSRGAILEIREEKSR